MLGRVAVLLASVLIAGAANAQVTYSYTGNTFLYIGGCCGVSNVSGFFIVDTALAANTTFANLSGSITNYNFTDGRYSWNPSNNPPVPAAPFDFPNEFSVTTDASGNIKDWQIDLVSNNPVGEISTQSLLYALGNGPTPGIGGDSLDAVNVYNNYDAYTYAPGNPNGEMGVQGTWSQSGVSVTPVPEPEIYAMLVAGLGLLGWQGRRRRKQGQLIAV